ncbi:MAG: adenine-specific methyltransferase EcoRI family protein [Candidatus Hydrogenedentes bacterium]|nr:adenine-specific methyltransferase EcoRI family protein [Candidatus Hydrogenedentota bacterium]
MESKSLNRGLGAAKAAKQDEFYTQYVDIQKEVEAYLEFDPDTFRDKVVYCNCDDPFESNFFKYFAANFNKLGLKKLITTSYDGSPIAGQLTLFPEYDEGNGKRQKPKALAVILDHVKDEDGDGAVNIDDVKLFLKRNKAARIALKGEGTYPGGDFRSPECIALLKEADIVVTNPPFSLFREYVAQLVEHGKKFLIIGNKNAITYKEIFPLIKENRLWMGVTPMGVDMLFDVPERVAKAMVAAGKKGSNYRIVNGKVMGRSTSVWFTNLDHGRRHQKLPLMTMEDHLRFSKHKEIKGKAAYDRYVNYDAIEVPYTDAIPSDYDGVMGVPISFLDKYNPDQFEILGSSMTLSVPMSQFAKKGSYLQGGPRFYIDNGDGSYRRMYDRIVIRHRARTATGRKK